MLKRRLIAAAAALLMAGVGAVLLTNYVTGADDRAMAGMATANVLVVTSVIPKGTSRDALGDLVVAKELPAKAIAPGTLTSLEPVAGRVTAVDLQPGEQLLDSRFVDPATLSESTGLKIPTGLQQLSIAMERPRMLGGTLAAGAKVGVFVSMTKEGDQPAQTRLMLNQVLVTQVGEPAPKAPVEGDAEPAAPVDPAALVLVTFAVTASDAEKIVFGAEHGRLWLSIQPPGAVTSGTQVVTPENVFSR